MLSGKTVLQHVIERCQSAELNPIVATTIEDDEIQSLCKSLNVKCFLGSVDDKIERWFKLTQKYNIKSFVTVDCDDPLFDASLSKAQFEMLNDVDMVSPDLDAFLGSNGWAITQNALEKICLRKISNKTEMIWKHIPKELIVKNFVANADPIEKNLRLTLDYEEDFWLISTVVRELGANCTRQQIIDFFKQNSGLRVVNDFRNIEWKLKQKQSA